MVNPKNISRRDFFQQVKGLGATYLGFTVGETAGKLVFDMIGGNSDCLISEHTIVHNSIPHYFDGGCIIHLTDFHIADGVKGWGSQSYLQRANQVTDSIKKIIETKGIPWNKVIIMVTGDIASKATTDYPSSIDYVDANTSFLSDLPTEHRYYVLGNHDNLTFPGPIHELLTSLHYTNIAGGKPIDLDGMLLQGFPDYGTRTKDFYSVFENFSKNYQKELLHIVGGHDPLGFQKVNLHQFPNILGFDGHTHGLQFSSSYWNMRTYIGRLFSKGILKYNVFEKNDLLTGIYHCPELQSIFFNTIGMGTHTGLPQTNHHEVTMTHLQKS